MASAKQAFCQGGEALSAEYPALPSSEEAGQGEEGIEAMTDDSAYSDSGIAKEVTVIPAV